MGVSCGVKEDNRKDSGGEKKKPWVKEGWGGDGEFKSGESLYGYHQIIQGFFFNPALPSLTHQKTSHNPGIEDKNIIKDVSSFSSLLSEFCKTVQGCWTSF